jgi:hypothetical protein
MTNTADERSELQGQRILATIRRLELRITQRFPGASLGRVCARLGELAGSAEAEIERLQRPLWLLRAGAALGIFTILVAAEEVLRMGMPGDHRIDSLADFLQGTEAALNLVVLAAIGIFFMVSLERRFKREAAMKSLYRLRSIIHIVDMHQLTKDPEYVVSRGTTTEASPARPLTRFQLSRYLDYCSEMFSLTSKVAALFSEHMHDPVVLDAVNEAETLAASLSQKVWQKVMILNALRPDQDAGAGSLDSGSRVP